MLRTVKAEVDINGTVHLLEPLRIEKKTQAILTLLEEESLEIKVHQFQQFESKKGNARRIQDLMKSPEFKNRKSYSAEEIEAKIEENRNSWD